MNDPQPLTVRSVLRAFRGGSSWPVLVEADGHRYVMKWSGSAEGPGANLADLIALRLARAVGIPVPTPHILCLTKEVIDPNQDPELTDLVLRSTGNNLGIDEVPAFEPFEACHRERIPVELRASVFALDLLLLNMDRIESNPNMVMTPDGLLCWDYAAAMELRMLLNGRPIDERRFYPLLRQHPFFRSDPLPELSWPRIDADIIGSMLQDVPNEWWLIDSIDPAIADRIAEHFADAPSTISRRHAGVAGIQVESAEDRTLRTNANRRAFEEAVQRLANKSGSSNPS